MSYRRLWIALFVVIFASFAALVYFVLKCRIQKTSKEGLITPNQTIESDDRELVIVN